LQDVNEKVRIVGLKKSQLLFKIFYSVAETSFHINPSDDL